MSAPDGFNWMSNLKQHLPLLLVPGLILIALPFIGSLPTWVTLTIAGLAMGMIIFVIASGLTLIFGLMDVLNFGHGAFIATGAYVAAAVMMLMPEALASTSLWSNLMALMPAVLAAMLVAGLLGWEIGRAHV